MRVNNALEQIFACYARDSGALRTGFSVAALPAKRRRRLLAGQIPFHYSRPASAPSPSLFFAVFARPANTAQRGVLQISATFSACQLFRANTERRSGGNNISVLIMKVRQDHE